MQEDSLEPRPVSSRHPPSLVLIVVVLGAALAGLACLQGLAPAYLTGRGFPLDDAWIHAVYGRELARSGTLAYNPGVPATGATSPLWAALVALPHLLFRHGTPVVLAIKLLGFALLGAAAFVTARAAGAPDSGPGRVGAALVVLYPPLLAASVSGMEVSLAVLAAAAVLASLRRGSALAYGLACAVAPLARPELAALGLGLPLFELLRPGDRSRTVRLWAAGAVGMGLSLGLSAWRNVAASGLPLPATFYAKVGAPLSAAPGSVARGFGELMGDLPLVGLPLVAVGSAMAIAALSSREERAPRDAARVWGAGLGLCTLSFVLVPPVDPVAFYHQRYTLPGVALLLASAPPLYAWALVRVASGLRRWAGVALVATAAMGLALDAPGRLRHLENDAHNIDDVQVAVGRSLASARPTEHVWAVDAGAVRYFGAPFVVDMLGLNTPEILGANATRYLDAHPPTYLELVPGWSALATDGVRLAEASFSPTTPYTVTSFPPMQLHVLARCGSSAQGVFEIGPRRHAFACAR